MRVVDEEDRIRLADAEAHDECLVMIGDDAGRPLIKMSVTAEGHGVIEADDGDLAEGIRQLSRLLSKTIRSGDVPGAFVS